MRTVHNWSTRRETWGEHHAAGCYNPLRVLMYRDRAGKHEVVISAGSSDEIDVLREDHTTYVLTSNRSLGYIGIEVFVAGEEEAGVYFEDYQLDDFDKLIEKTPINQVKYLQGYL